MTKVMGRWLGWLSIVLRTIGIGINSRWEQFLPIRFSFSLCFHLCGNTDKQTNKQTNKQTFDHQERGENMPLGPASPGLAAIIRLMLKWYGERSNLERRFTVYISSIWVVIGTLWNFTKSSLKLS